MTSLLKMFNSYWAAHEHYAHSRTTFHLHAPCTSPIMHLICAPKFGKVSSRYYSLCKRSGKQCLCKILGSKKGALWEMCKWRMSKKDKMADGTPKRLCMSHSPFNGAVLQTGLDVDLERTQNYCMELLALYDAE